MNLYYTPRSHFSRKVRILLAALAIDIDLIDTGNVAGFAAEAFGPNPLMKVPTLVDGNVIVFDSDQICAYITRKYDPADRYRVLTNNAQTLNMRTVMNGIMSAEVDLILAARAGIDTQSNARFDKMRGAIASGLRWLEERNDLFSDGPTYSGFHLTAMWDHLQLYDATPLDFPGLAAAVRKISSLPFVAASRPS